MRKMGLEPTRPNGHKILSLARLPIPTLPQTIERSRFCCFSDSTNASIALCFSSVNTFFNFFVEVFWMSAEEGT